MLICTSIHTWLNNYYLLIAYLSSSSSLVYSLVTEFKMSSLIIYIIYFIILNLITIILSHFNHNQWTMTQLLSIATKWKRRRSSIDKPDVLLPLDHSIISHWLGEEHSKLEHSLFQDQLSGTIFLSTSELSLTMNNLENSLKHAYLHKHSHMTK